MTFRIKWIAFLLLSICAIAACGEPPAPTDPAKGAPATTAESAGEDGTEVETESALTTQQLLDELGIELLAQRWTGDLDGMVERRIIRVLTVYGLGRYFLDGPQEAGTVYEAFKEFEKQLNEKLKTRHVRVHVIFVPVARDELISGLIEGRGDIAAAGLTITPERLELVDFSDPLTKELQEILVTGPAATPLDSIEDLSGQEVFVRPSSSYRSSLEALNRRLREAGKPEVILVDAPEMLEDEDLLEMVQVGMLPWVVVDDYKAKAWAESFPDIVARNDLVLREGGQLGYALRKDSPQLQAELNAFVKEHRQGTLFGNMMINRYIRDFDWPKNALAPRDYERFARVIEIFRKYGQQYGIDFLVVAAQGYQESQLDQSRRSKAGAVGIMQLLPSTAADPAVGIPDISTAENNIHAGVKYLDHIRSEYFSDPGMSAQQGALFALAAYNAGPARIQGLRKKAAAEGYDPNQWFDNVEIIAAREIGRETVQYVANIMKYYTAYYLSVQRFLERSEARDSQGLETPQTD